MAYSLQCTLDMIDTHNINHFIWPSCVLVHILRIIVDVGTMNECNGVLIVVLLQISYIVFR